MKDDPASLAIALTISLVVSTVAHPGRAEAGENDYGKKGKIELGGAVDASWRSDLVELGVTPAIGYFVHDRVALSLRLNGTYENVKKADGSQLRSTLGFVVIEPSYHFPLDDHLALFGGLGLGLDHDGSDTEFEFLPRLGLNIEVGKSEVFTPAIRVPILIGRNRGADNDQIGVAGGIAFEAGFSTTF